MPFQELNDHVIWVLISWFDAVELFNFGLTCKRFYEATNSPKLWMEVAQRFQDEFTLPMLYGEVLADLPLERIRRITIRASSLQQNLQRPHPSLTNHTIVKPSWTFFKRMAIPDEAVDCLKIFNRKWILYRRPDSLAVRHVDAVGPKAKIFDIPIIGYAGWPFELAQVDKRTALVGIRHDVNEEWLILEVVLGETKNDKPKVRPLPLDRAQTLSLVGRGYAVIRSRGAERLVNVFTHQTATIDPHPVGDKSYLILNRYFFTVYSRPGGRIHISASRLGKVKDANSPIISSNKSKFLIKLKEACAAFPDDHHSAHTIIRPSSTKSQVTIWHWIPTEYKDENVYALFIIELNYFIPNAFQGDELIEWGTWSFRSSYTPIGNFWVGKDGQSAVVARYKARRAHLSVYPRLQIPVNEGLSSLKHRGISLPVPDETCSGESSRSIRVTWDDCSGVGVLLFETGMLWVLHYA